MAKNIAVSDELYNILSKLKRPKESFTEVIMRSIKYSTSLMDIAGEEIIPAKEWEKIKQIFHKKESKDLERKKALIGEISDVSN